MGKKGNSSLRREQRGSRRTEPRKGGGTRNNITLTPGEMQALRLTAQGLGMPAIAKQMNLTRKTIQSFRRNIKIKFGLPSGAEPDEMLAEARRLGFIQR